MTSSRYWPLSWMSRQYSWYLSAPSAPNIPDSMISEKPMMALSGVRNSWLMLARNFDLAWLASSARFFSSAYFSASSVELRARDWRRSATVAISRFSLSISFFSLQLERGDVGADRDIAAVLGAALADLQPVAVVELRLEGARAGHGRVRRAVSLGADHVLAAGGDHVLVGRAGGDGVVGQVVQILEVGIAQHQPVVGVPQHEGLRDGLDGVAQAHIGGGGLLDQGLLLGDVDRDADQMQAGLAGLAHQLAARAQPDPFAAGMAHAEVVVDGAWSSRRRAGVAIS